MLYFSPLDSCTSCVQGIKEWELLQAHTQPMDISGWDLMNSIQGQMQFCGASNLYNFGGGAPFFKKKKKLQIQNYVQKWIFTMRNHNKFLKT